MMGLGPHLGRQRAHDLVYDICRKVAATGAPLVELLAQNADISRHLTRAELDKMCDPGRLSRPRRRDGGQGAGARASSQRLIAAASIAGVTQNVAGHLPVMTAFLTFRLLRARVIVHRKFQEGKHEDDVACRRSRGGARVRQLRCWRAGARLSIASRHDDRAVPRRRPDRHARAHPGRAHAGVARPNHHRRERDRRRIDHRRRPGRPGGGGRLHAGARQLDQLRRVRRALPHVVRFAQRFRAGLAAHVCAHVDRREKCTAGKGRQGADRLAQGQPGQGIGCDRRCRQRGACVRALFPGQDRKPASSSCPIAAAPRRCRTWSAGRSI